MKKAILAITLALCMLPMVFAAEGAMYVGIEPKLQLPSYDLTKGDQITGLGFGIGLDRITMNLLELANLKEAMFLFRGPDRLTP